MEPKTRALVCQFHPAAIRCRANPGTVGGDPRFVIGMATRAARIVRSPKKDLADGGATPRRVPYGTKDNLVRGGREPSSPSQGLRSALGHTGGGKGGSHGGISTGILA